MKIKLQGQTILTLGIARREPLLCRILYLDQVSSESAILERRHRHRYPPEHVTMVGFSLRPQRQTGAKRGRANISHLRETEREGGRRICIICESNVAAAPLAACEAKGRRGGRGASGRGASEDASVHEKWRQKRHLRHNENRQQQKRHSSQHQWNDMIPFNVMPQSVCLAVETWKVVLKYKNC